MYDFTEIDKDTVENLTQQQFVVAIENPYSLLQEETRTFLYATLKRKLVALRLLELALFDKQPLASAGGVYLFLSDDNICLYVGKAISHSFISRIPAHFSPNSDAWLATVPRRLIKIEYVDNHLSDCACQSYTGMLETYLLYLLKPSLNPLKHSKNLSSSKVTRLPTNALNKLVV